MTNPWNLTDREAEVLQRLTELHSNKAVARQLNLSIRTVEMHLVAIRKSMRAASRVEAVLLWDRWARAQG
jgi:DNA-binding CsgD family transcriptional regulator